MRSDYASRLLVFSSFLFFLMLHSCVPARKAMYFPDLKQTQITIDSLGRETAKKVYSGDRIMVEVITNDAEGMALMNQGQKMSGGSSGVNNQQTQGYLVDPDGYIQIPTIGRIYVQGHTPTEIRELVHAKVTELYWDATVYCQINGRVVILNSLNQSAGMSGGMGNGAAVLSIPLSDERLTIPEVLSGLRTNNLKLDRAWIIREIDGKRVVAQLNLNSMEILQSPYFYLRNNDIIYIEPNRLNQFLEANLPARNLVGLITGFSGLVFGLIALFK